MSLERTEPRVLILFGAGASHGSQGILPFSPPLGADLFGALRVAYPYTWGSVWPRELRLKFDESFELGMDALWQIYPLAAQSKIPGFPCPSNAMRDVAAYFLQFSIDPHEHTLYSALIRQLRDPIARGQIGFATLNYETILSQALRSAELSDAALYLHGRVDTWAAKGGQIFADAGRAIGAGMHVVSKRISHLTTSQVRSRLLQPMQAAYPPLAVYMPSKRTQIGQNYLWRIQSRFAQRAAAAKLIVIVGAKPSAECDHHIWMPIARSRALIVGVTGGADFANWQRGSKVKNSLLLGERFQEQLSAIADLSLNHASES
jgi:hypothetical protein